MGHIKPSVEYIPMANLIRPLTKFESDQNKFLGSGPSTLVTHCGLLPAYDIWHLDEHWIIEISIISRDKPKT